MSVLNVNTRPTTGITLLPTGFLFKNIVSGAATSFAQRCCSLNFILILVNLPGMRGISEQPSGPSSSEEGVP